VDCCCPQITQIPAYRLAFDLWNFKIWNHRWTRINTDKDRIEYLIFKNADCDDDADFWAGQIEKANH
jgi:hypothetical protein